MQKRRNSIALDLMLKRRNSIALGLMQKRRNSIVTAMELRLFCIKPSIYVRCFPILLVSTYSVPCRVSETSL